MYQVIVVDDEKMPRDRMCRYVEKIPGIQLVGSMCNGIEVKDFFENQTVDMVITDIRMPLMDGLELTGWLREYHPECEVILISGYEDFEYARKAIQFGVKSYLVKPIRVEEFTELLTMIKDKRDETERKNLFIQDMRRKDKDAFFKEWMQNAKIGVSDGIQYFRGGFYVIEENQEYQGKREFLRIALANILQWVAPTCYPIFVDKKGWNYRFIVMYEKEELRPDEKAIEERTKRLFGCTFRACYVGDFSKPEELHRLVGGNAYIEDEIISLVTDYIMKHLKEPIGRDDAAAMAYMDPNYFSRYFKSKTGMNFKDYVLQMRMEEAKKLLKKGMQVKDVCDQVGYHDRDHFNKLFKQYTGMSPIEYKRNLDYREGW